MNDSPEGNRAAPKVADINTAEAVFAVGALILSVAAVSYGTYLAGAESNYLNTGALLLSQLVCLMNFRSWKIIVSLFLNAGKGSVGAADPETRSNSYLVKRVILGLSLKTAAIVSSIVFILKTDDRGVLWFIGGFSAYLILGLVLLVVHHLWTTKMFKSPA